MCAHPESRIAHDNPRAREPFFRHMRHLRLRRQGTSQLSSSYTQPCVHCFVLVCFHCLYITESFPADEYHATTANENSTASDLNAFLFGMDFLFLDLGAQGGHCGFLLCQAILSFIFGRLGDRRDLFMFSPHQPGMEEVSGGEENQDIPRLLFFTAGG
ncbi:hypothetical protein B0T25DRAFT_88676 [Lasiosphaeria hispida]|uniref:Uncharacterized protein n=1 Tax=Lasiosphaeria hispida TaxID=260671 RepID=A0AAJ0HPQ1_9PEZI|nr:hypothetical protein B0T25DRAFT_88676 [Lasiosphaeria hispida]